MLHFVTIVLAVCALVIGLALARLITRWYADQ
jgi:ABC-type arginine transport system permease subunit